VPTSTAIAAGELRHKITIAQADTTEDKFGGANPGQAGATPLWTVWASVEALTLRELYGAQQKVSEVTHRVTIRYIRGVTSGMLIWFRGRQFQIQAIDNPRELNKLLVLLCLERDDSLREESGGGGEGEALGSGGSGPFLMPPASTIGLMTETFTADGSTNVFTISGTPVGAVLWYRNGLLQAAPDDYSRSGQQITVALSAGAISGDTFIAAYDGS